MQYKPISATRVQTLLSQRVKLLTEVNNSLKGGPPINWKAGDRAAYTSQLRGLGFHLVTKGQARALGLDIAPDTPPVGRGEFGPPLSQFLDLYILEVQATEPVEEPPPEATQVAATPAKPKSTRKKVGRGAHRATAVLEAEAKPEPKPTDKHAKVQWLTTLEAAHYLGKTPKAMQMMRYQHSGPAYQRTGNHVMYKSTDLDAWLATKA
ncbi:MAG: helix-turn-helix domain-containing protein [Candidatus Tectomicrobia bacterium]|nr:helix-turn-helix domain-containing protein [Candidatus Tectomicrobia bacterium]